MRIEWAIFRVNDGVDGSPVEPFRFPTREAAQKAIDGGYVQPQLWEPRAREVGPWSRTLYV